jgi:hypothetical protein
MDAWVGSVVQATIARAWSKSQIDEYFARARRGTCCGQLRKVHDRRTRALQTLFGSAEIDAPRLKPCGCRSADGRTGTISSPISQLLPGRSTPELQRVQAELGARQSFREASRLLSSLLPSSPPNHETLRNRLHRAATDLEGEEAVSRCSGLDARGKTENPERPDLIALIDGAHIRATSGHQTRHLDVTVGKVEGYVVSHRGASLWRRGEPIGH